MGLFSALNSVSAVLLSTLLMLTGYGMFQTFIALRFSIEGFSQTIVGIQSSIFFIGMISGTFLSAKVINRAGRIRAYTVFSAIGASSILIIAMTSYLPAWLLQRFLFGLCVAGQYMVVESWLNARTTAVNRGLILAIYVMVTNVGYGGGQFILNFADIKSNTLFITAAILYTVALIPVAMTKASSPEEISTGHFNLKKLFDISPVAIIGCISCGIIISSLFSLSPTYLSDINFPISQLSLFMALINLGGLATQVPVGKLSDKMDRRYTMIGVLVIMSLVSIPIILSDVPSAMNLLIYATIFGGCAMTIYPLCISHANDHIEAKDMVKASGGLVLSYSVGAAIGPTLTGGIMQYFGSQTLFQLSLTITVMLILYILYRVKVQEAVPEENKEAFVALPDASITPWGSDIDPRHEYDKSARKAPTTDYFSDDEIQSFIKNIKR